MQTSDQWAAYMKKIPISGLLKNWPERLEKYLPKRFKDLQKLLDSSLSKRDPNSTQIRLSLDWAKKFWAYVKDPKVSSKNKVIPLMALLYLVFPLDGVFDPLPLIGLSDDVLVLLWAAGKSLKDFKDWEKKASNS